MLRNGRERNPERLRQHARWFLSIFQKNEDLSASWMRDRVKHVVLLQRPHRLFAPWGVVALDSLKSGHQSGRGLLSNWASSRSNSTWVPGANPDAVRLVSRRYVTVRRVEPPVRVNS